MSPIRTHVPPLGDLTENVGRSRKVDSNDMEAMRDVAYLHRFKAMDGFQGQMQHLDIITILRRQIMVHNLKLYRERQTDRTRLQITVL